MVVLAFLIPLSLTVRDLASDQALTAAQNQAEAIAQLIALRSPGATAEEAVSNLPLGLGEYDASILLSAQQYYFLRHQRILNGRKMKLACLIGYRAAKRFPKFLNQKVSIRSRTILEQSIS